MAELRGVSPIVTTPFTETGAVDHDSLENVIQKHIDEGCTSLTFFGLASEFYKLTDSERERIIDVAMELCHGQEISVVITITHHATSIARDRAIRAASAGADAIMVLPPFFLHPSVSDICSHVRRVATAVDIPVIVQYAPGPTGITVQPEQFAELATEVDSVDYFKVEATPPGGYISELLDRTNGSVDIFVGKAGLRMFEAFDRGAVGVMPGSPLSDLYVKICRLYDQGRIAEARTLFDTMLPLLNHITQSPEMAFYYGKEILARRDVIASRNTREPAFEPDDIHDEQFDSHYEAISKHL